MVDLRRINMDTKCLDSTFYIFSDLLFFIERDFP